MESIGIREEWAQSVIRHYCNEGVLIHNVLPGYFSSVEKYWRLQAEHYLDKVRSNSVDSEAAKRALKNLDPSTNLSTTYLQKDQKSCIAFTLRHCCKPAIKFSKINKYSNKFIKYD